MTTKVEPAIKRKEEPISQETDRNDDKIFNLHDYNIILHNLTNSGRFNDNNFHEILGDSGASRIIFNRANMHLASELEPAQGSILGAGGVQIGAVSHSGRTEFMGVIVPCFVADISKSVVSLGYLLSYGFEFRLKGHYMDIYAERSGRSASIKLDYSFLFPIPETLFQPVEINAMITSLSQNSIKSLWHHRLGHINDRKLAYMGCQECYQKRGLILSKNNIKNSSEIRVLEEEYCDCCALVKGHKVRSHKVIDHSESEIGLDWHVDVSGKSEVPAIVTGNNYTLTFTDRNSAIRLVIGLHDKSAEEIQAAVCTWHHKMLLKVKSWYGKKYNDRVPITLLSDNLEFKYPQVQETVARCGAEQFFTAKHHSSSNGVAERGFGVLRPMARALLKAKDLPEEFWELATRHSNFLLNRVPCSKRGEFQKDPYQLWTGKIFDYSKLRIFGSRCYVLEPGLPKNMQPRSERGIYVGHADNSNAYLIYLPHKNDFTTSEDVRFFEQADDIFSIQKTPEEVDSMREAFERIGAFLMSEKTQN